MTTDERAHAEIERLEDLFRETLRPEELDRRLHDAMQRLDADQASDEGVLEPRMRLGSG